MVGESRLERLTTRGLVLRGNSGHDPVCRGIGRRRPRRRPYQLLAERVPGDFPRLLPRWPRPARRSQWFERQLADGAEILVADDGEVIGFCWVGNSDDDSRGEIHSIYVQPDHWDRGHGQALLLRAEAHLAAMGHHLAFLRVLEANGRGRRIYERQGWGLGTATKVEDIGATRSRSSAVEHEAQAFSYVVAAREMSLHLARISIQPPSVSQ
ncbi:MAG: GNAT family N-acetyltransferase [Acidimicrobiia bacterium]